jgi:methionyl-tRNA formyltransferase
MKILLCTKHDLVGSMMLNRILPQIASEHRVSVILANRRRPENAAIPELKWMKLFEQDLPARLLFPLLDARDASGTGDAGEAWQSFAQLSRRYRVPITEAGHIEQSSTLTAMVREHAPDLVVSFQFGFIFKPEALDIPRLGALNLHSGALPARAGVNPTFWCMKDGDPEAACTLHWIDRGIDSGPLVEVRRMPIDYGRSFFANWIANYRNGAQMIVDAIRMLAGNTALPSIPQEPGSRVYVPTPTAADFEAFFAAGRRMIDPEDYLELLDRYLPPPERLAT